MKKLRLVLIGITLLLSCVETQTPLEELVDLRCDCLKLYDAEKDNLIEMANCMQEVNANGRFSELGEEEIIKMMEKTCPDAALPERKAPVEP